MRSIRLRAYAKVNFYLDVVRRRPDGYHDLETLFQSIALYDEVAIRQTGASLRVRCDHPQVPQDAGNVAFRAALRLLESAGVSERGFEIHIHKRIPVAAGLAGGSADAAAVLVGLNELLGLGYSREQLQQIGLGVGADVPFCLQGGTALGTGIGERLQPLPTVEGYALVIANPGFPISTAWAFRQLSDRKIGLTKPKKNVTILIRSLEAKNWPQVGDSLYNIFQPIVVSHYPMVGELLERLTRLGACGALMTGSGPTIFGLVPEVEVASRIAAALNVPYRTVTRPHPQGVQFL